MHTERIQKVLAAAGFGARRACELLVLDGRVSVNGKRVRVLPVMVDPAKDDIHVDGKPVRLGKRVYFLLNKPRSVYCTHNDPAGRRLAIDLLAGVRERLFPVGRLDADSTGLLIMTNDGALAQKLTHPRFGIPKTYRVHVAGALATETLDKLRGGIWLADGKTARATITVVHRQRDKSILEITLREGRNREIRRMLLRAGCKVRRLIRIRIGKLSIRGLPVGAYRRLTPAEVEYLDSLAEHFPDKGPPPKPTRARKTTPVRRKSSPAQAERPKKPRPARPSPAKADARPNAKPKAKVRKKRPPGAAAKSQPAKSRPPKARPPKSRQTKGRSPKSGPAKTAKPRRMLLPE